MEAVEYYGTGRRKSSTARVFLRPGKGTFVVNGREFEGYFKNETLRMIIKQPFLLTETSDKFDILVNVDGGGPSGQAGAVRLGISRALLEFPHGDVSRDKLLDLRSPNRRGLRNRE